MADHRERVHQRAGAHRQKIQLEGGGTGRKAEVTGSIEMMQVMALYPVPAEDKVGVHVHSMGDTNIDSRNV